MSLPWLKMLEEKSGIIVGSTPTTTVEKRRHKQHKDVIYPVFEDCAALADGEWKKLFEDLAHGMLPKGYSIRNKSLAHTTHYKTVPIRLDLEPEALKDAIIALFTTSRGITRHNCNEEVTKPTQLPSSWSKIKDKINKKNYIVRYVCSRATELGWIDEQIALACDQIVDHLNNGYIKKAAIVMEEGKITSISGVTFEDGRLVLKKTEEKRPKSRISRIHISRMYCDVINRTPKIKSNKPKLKETVTESESTIA